uniref:DUF3800 domain-containing protein n=1 Tax=Rhabditophanes sp. KR3021 TaxID=114890 RepID=A0AC35U9Q8_9BILA
MNPYDLDESDPNYTKIRRPTFKDTTYSSAVYKLHITAIALRHRWAISYGVGRSEGNFWESDWTAFGRLAPTMGCTTLPPVHNYAHGKGNSHRIAENNAAKSLFEIIEPYGKGINFEANYKSEVINIAAFLFDRIKEAIPRYEFESIQTGKETKIVATCFVMDYKVSLEGSSRVKLHRQVAKKMYEYLMVQYQKKLDRIELLTLQRGWLKSEEYYVRFYDEHIAKLIKIIYSLTIPTFNEKIEFTFTTYTFKLEGQDKELTSATQGIGPGDCIRQRKIVIAIQVGSLLELFEPDERDITFY